MTHEEITLSLDLEENSYSLSNRDKVYEIPQAIDVTVVTAQSELTGRGRGVSAFFLMVRLLAAESRWSVILPSGKSI